VTTAPHVHGSDAPEDIDNFYMIVVKGLSLRKCHTFFPSLSSRSVVSPSEVLSIETYERTEAIACQG